MNLLSLILVFLAVVICAAIAFIARELIREAEREKPAGQGPTGGDGAKVCGKEDPDDRST